MVTKREAVNNGLSNLGVGLAMAWGLGWIAYGRAAGEPRSAVVAVVATFAALAALAVAIWFFARRVHPSTGHRS